ncbi:MAG: 3-oxoadipyl-CoA thiolase [Gammaproteobacteria bacterium]|nr:MAG: 3-oxoadipyl-CoA thiolase [Gammaproteobacteria bacterium]RLA13823.1 MAG: 3-oxoadipyl-CoA thiolase [Gammaproteobacteria bacterium]RLA17729.1 MAG: 3-oxoadipyl-CoA thiolase [Gammaproteobacteria bacterium]
MLDAYIYDGARTAFGKYCGALAQVRPDDLAAGVIKALVERNGFDPALIDDVILGCACQSGEDSRNVARYASLLAGLPVSVSAQTVNRLCGSSLAAIIDSARAITCGEGELFIAGGVESMTRAPLTFNKSNTAFSKDITVYDSAIGVRFPNAEFGKQFGHDAMPVTADKVAVVEQVSREQCDLFAFNSQLKWEQATAAGYFADEIVPVSIPQRRGKPPIVVEVDEHPRAGASLEKMASMNPLFDDGVVTAANASGVNDGAAAVIVGSREFGQQHDMQPMVRILGGAAAGVEPSMMGLGPVPACQKLLKRLGLTLEQMDLIEINEAFSAQVLGDLKQLGIAEDDGRINPNGGAIAVGHPLGASGARIALTAARQLQRSGGRYALVSMCIGVGQGIAMVMERME